MDNELEKTISDEIENTYNYYKSLDIFEDSNCNTVHSTIPLTIANLKEHYKIKLDDKNKKTNTNIYCYKQDSNTNKNKNNTNTKKNNGHINKKHTQKNINNTSKNSYTVNVLIQTLLDYFKSIYPDKQNKIQKSNGDKTFINNNNNNKTKAKEINIIPIYLKDTNEITILAHIITFNQHNITYVYVFLVYDYYNTNLHFNDFIPMIKKKKILNKKLNSKKANEASDSYCVSNAHEYVHKKLTNFPAVLLHLLLKSDKFIFKNVCDTSLIFNTIEESINLIDDNYEKKFTICSEGSYYEDGMSRTVCQDNKPFYDNIKTFFTSEKRIFIGFIRILKKTGLLGMIGSSSGHTNMFIIDKKRQIIIQFEPKGDTKLTSLSFYNFNLENTLKQSKIFTKELDQYTFLNTSTLSSIDAYCYRKLKADIYYLNQNKNSSNNKLPSIQNLTFAQGCRISSDIVKTCTDNNCQSYTFCGALLYCLNPDYIGHPKNLNLNENDKNNLPLLLLTKYGVTYEKVVEFRHLLNDFLKSIAKPQNSMAPFYNEEKPKYTEDGWEITPRTSSTTSRSTSSRRSSTSSGNSAYESQPKTVKTEKELLIDNYNNKKMFFMELIKNDKNKTKPIVELEDIDDDFKSKLLNEEKTLNNNNRKKISMMSKYIISRDNDNGKLLYGYKHKHYNKPFYKSKDTLKTYLKDVIYDCTRASLQNSMCDTSGIIINPNIIEDGMKLENLQKYLFMFDKQKTIKIFSKIYKLLNNSDINNIKFELLLNKSKPIPIPTKYNLHKKKSIIKQFPNNNNSNNSSNSNNSNNINNSNNTNNINKDDLNYIMYILGIEDQKHLLEYIPYFMLRLFKKQTFTKYYPKNIFLYCDNENKDFVIKIGKITKQVESIFDPEVDKDFATFTEIIDKKNNNDYSYTFIEIDEDKILHKN